MSSDESGSRSPVLLMFLGLIAFMAGWTAINFRGGVADANDLAHRPKANGVVETCVKEGPVSLSGIGYWWSCDVTVTNENGDTYTQRFGGSQFEPDDEGTQFALASAGLMSDNWSRADIDANDWAVVVTAIGLIAGSVLIGMSVRQLLGRA